MRASVLPLRPLAGRSQDRVRRFDGPWPQACARLQLYLLEMFAGRPDPSMIHIRLAKPLVTPEQLRRDVPMLREALVRRLGPGRVHWETTDDAGGHELRLEWRDKRPGLQALDPTAR